ncbi:hypothetical protein PV371_30370 [Streptomyces sp. TX20-6-3]|uniref:hypothetical protein n=1 Tax=Streptomyces sp. TX20-6-3 TaxID=3028705 RepID=UPI0029B2BD5B|nr:hypothetical protein [Streptomyces sp. TX20-6-3]MDX2563929.1 hypothetical protein [Streptomyces sp. TX20-6-3]
MGDIDPTATPDNLHATGTEDEQIGTKNLHATSAPANAIADKVLTQNPDGAGASTNNLHATSEPAK